MEKVLNQKVLNEIIRLKTIVAKATENGLDTFTSSELEEAKSVSTNVYSSIQSIEGLSKEYEDLCISIRSFHKALEKYIV